ncbi:MAG: TetR/AcrR family transcriptional regulator [Acidimicrobiales bacterium]|nr:TetR/AcrR family transcriptional regulator [Acidimicrobiales bacterium]
MNDAAQARTRLHPETRKELLRAEARRVFAERGYALSGLAEIAERAGVNKRLLYYYYPDGRPELFTAVMADLTAELLEVVRTAVSAPVNTARRVERLVDALVGFFEQQPDAFNLLFRDPFGVRETEVVQEAVAVQSELARELAKLFAHGGIPPLTLVGITSGTLAYVLRVIELNVTGELDREATVDACLTCILGVMSQLGGPRSGS